MRNRLCVLLLVFLIFGATAAAQTHYGLTDVMAFRDGRDKEFKTPVESPLLDVDFANFEGLSYFEIDEKYKVPAVFTVTPDETYFLFPTSSGKSVKYRKFGELRFELDGRELTLNAYQSEKIMTNEVWNKKFGGSLFVPFMDPTNGVTTYPGGRYLYLKMPETPETVLDFNLAYNPSCAYGSTKYSCPIPPRSNRLSIEIEAGEKIFSYTKERK